MEAVVVAASAFVVSVFFGWQWWRRTHLHAHAGEAALRSSSCWRILRDDEEVRQATERALNYERERVREQTNRANRYQLELERLGPAGEVGGSTVRLMPDPSGAPGPEAA